MLKQTAEWYQAVSSVAPSKTQRAESLLLTAFQTSKPYVKVLAWISNPTLEVIKENTNRYPVAKCVRGYFKAFLLPNSESLLMGQVIQKWRLVGWDSSWLICLGHSNSEFHNSWICSHLPGCVRCSAHLCMSQHHLLYFPQYRGLSLHVLCSI